MENNTPEGMKKCSKCGEWKPATAEFFGRNKTRPDGLQTWCGDCRRGRASEYYQKNKDRKRKYNREYNQKNKDRKRKYNREYNQKNKDRLREYDREYYQKNKDHILEQKREYQQKNKDRLREYDREYREKNKEKIADRKSEYNREYYQKNKEEIAERQREYEQSPVGRLAKSIYRLRRKTGATIYVRDMTDEQKETLANQYVAVRTLEKTERGLLAASGKKRCSKCGGVFDFDVFHKRGSRRASVCKACANERERKYRQQQKQKST